MNSKSVKTIGGMLGVAVAISLSACGSSPSADTDGAEALPVVNKGDLTVCISKNAYEPLYWNDSGDWQGFDLDSIRAIADELDLKVELNVSAFDGLLPALLSGRCDVLRSGLYLNEERAEKTDAVPYLTTGPALIVEAGNPLNLTSTEDLSGVRVAVQGASANEQILRSLSEELEAAGKPGIELSVYPELPETVAALQNGRVDATIETDVAAVQAAKTLGEGFEVADTIFPAETNFGMFLPKNSELTPTMIEAAKKLTDDGTFASFAEKYGLSPDRIVTPELVTKP